jgi:hypothetical protein
MLKKCCICNEEKQLTEFRKDKSQTKGYQHLCKLCARNRSNAHYQKYRESILARNKKRSEDVWKYIREYKEKNSCICCGEKEIICLDFHHVDPTQKDFQLSSATTQSLENVQTEINKCVLVCKNCHAKIHAGIISCPPTSEKSAESAK